jgi:hypothetical protein
MFESNINFNPSEMFSFLIDPPFETTFFVLKLAFIGVSLFFLVSIIYFLRNTHWLQYAFGERTHEFLSKQPYGSKSIGSIWKDIAKRLDTGLESEYKLAVIEADGLTDEVLKRMGYKGTDFEDMLNKVSVSQISNIEEIKKAHKVRGDIVRDPDYRLSSEDAKKIMEVYKKTLDNLEAF